jgi:hypothetical protein
VVLSDGGITFIIFFEHPSNGKAVGEVQIRIIVAELLIVPKEMKVLELKELSMMSAHHLGVLARSHSIEVGTTTKLATCNIEWRVPNMKDLPQYPWCERFLWGGAGVAALVALWLSL